jgi:trk system potassium uptake protein TrkH
MVLGSVNYALYYALLRERSLRRVLQNVELKVFLALVVGATLAITAMLYSHGVHRELELAFRRSLFLVGTSVSSTGFTTDTFTVYPSPAFGLMIFIMFIGGCSGSTAGGLKVERVVLFVKQSVAQVMKSFRPSSMLNVRMGRAVVENEVLADVAAFFLIYMGCMAGGRLRRMLDRRLPRPPRRSAACSPASATWARARSTTCRGWRLAMPLP